MLGKFAFRLLLALGLLLIGFIERAAPSQAECTAIQTRHHSDRPARPDRESSPDPICLSELPAEARETLQLIKQGGPFPYSKDGAIFGNRERLLPLKSKDYYREYTVETPGSADRGARRIVAGRSGEYYYTDDHYRSFRRILE